MGAAVKAGLKVFGKGFAGGAIGGGTYGALKSIFG